MKLDIACTPSPDSDLLCWLEKQGKLLVLKAKKPDGFPSYILSITDEGKLIRYHHIGLTGLAIDGKGAIIDQEEHGS